jgi:hypothetical protein
MARSSGTVKQTGMGESSMVLAMRKLLSMGWSLQMIAKNVGVSAVSVAQGLG